MPRISLRQLLLLTAAIALVIVSLKYASVFWQGFIGLLAMIAIFAAVIVGVFERGPRQAFAIGFAIVVVGYLLLIVAGLRSELPTSLLLDRLYSAISEPGWRDVNTGQRVTGQTLVNFQATGGQGFSPVESRSYPLGEFYYPVGHYWWTLALGCAGGSFARFIYVRRRRDRAAQPPSN